MLVNVILMGICFDFYYDLNDDTMMKDIMSGVYTGTPDAHNMQTLYILGLFISWCYRLCRTVPWYGLFLCLCQFGCFYLLGMRLMQLADRRDASIMIDTIEGEDRTGNAAVKGTDRTGKIVMLLVLSLLLWSICLPHLVNVQYTITCAVMSATAIFLFLTTPETDSTMQFVIRNIPAVLLMIIAYQLRTEMLLLSLPFAALAGMFRWSEETQIFTRANWRKYGTVAGIMLLGILLSRCIDFGAYGSKEWQDFQDFFDARTTVYDFYPEVVTQDEFAAGLESVGVTSVQQTLLRNYNFGLDDGIDTSMLDTIADYAVDTVGASRDWGAVVREKCRMYVYRLFHAGDAPYNIVVLWAYAAVLAAGFCVSHGKAKADGMKTGGTKADDTKTGNAKVGGTEKESVLRRYAFVWQTMLLAVTRTAIWMFILLRGRDPERITHSLYLIEFALLAAILVRLIHSCRIRNYVMHGMSVLFLLIVAGNLMTSIQEVQCDQRYRETVNQDFLEIDAYCREHKENFYFEDVYSTVAFSQKMFANVNNTYANYDILGGWMCKSPLYQEKLVRYGTESAADALLNQDNVYFIMSNAEAADRGLDWMIDYYADRGVAVSVQKSDTINENYAVYEIIQ